MDKAARLIRSPIIRKLNGGFHSAPLQKVSGCSAKDSSGASASVLTKQLEKADASSEAQLKDPEAARILARNKAWLAEVRSRAARLTVEERNAIYKQFGLPVEYFDYAAHGLLSLAHY